MDFDLYERHLDVETGVLHRFSNFEPDLSSRVVWPGSHCGKVLVFAQFHKHVLCLWENNSKMVAAKMFPEVPNVTSIRFIWPGMG